MIITKKNMNTLLKGVIAAMPAIPFLAKAGIWEKRRTSTTAWVLGGLGMAVAGGLAAVMFLSPRMRARALVAAKETYNKAEDKLTHLRSPNGKIETPISNGLVDHGDFHSATTGL